MNLDNLKLGDITKLKAANAAARKANKDAMTKLAGAKKLTGATAAAIEANAADLSTTDD